MKKDLGEQDENDLLEMNSVDQSAIGKNTGQHLSEVDDDDDLLEIPGLRADQPPSANQTQVVGTPDAAGEAVIFESPEESKISEPEFENIRETAYQTPVEPESIGETARKSGLAYGAALTLFGSVVVALLLGWLADRLFGTSPWGIIIGIVLGAVIGFYQFFRITSQIFKNKN